jgi:hypothetical protein
MSKRGPELVPVLERYQKSLFLTYSSRGREKEKVDLWSPGITLPHAPQAEDLDSRFSDPFGEGTGALEPEMGQSASPLVKSCDSRRGLAFLGLGTMLSLGGYKRGSAHLHAFYFLLFTFHCCCN